MNASPKISYIRLGKNFNSDDDNVDDTGCYIWKNRKITINWIRIANILLNFISTIC